MPQANRVCKTCGTQYYFCTNCDKTLNSPQWMLMWHSENCKNVFEIVSDYVQKRISKADAKTRIQKCDLRKYYSFTEQIRNYIDEINAEDPVVEESTPTRSTTRATRSTRRKRS